MTAATSATAARARGNILPTLGLLFLTVVVGLGGWAIWSADPAIDDSVIGTTGLAVALPDVETLTRPVRSDDGRPTPALRVLPLYDNDLRREESEFSQSRDLRQELRMTRLADVSGKVLRAPTLVVLPKWRLGALAQAVFHPTYLVDAAMRLPLAGPGAKLGQAEPVFETFETSGRFAAPITLYAAQTLRLPSGGETCTPVVWRGRDRYAAVLLARCERNAATFHILSDPDLVNNHGLGLGENAAFAGAMIAGLAGGGKTYVDLYEGETFPRPTRRDRRGRSLADLARFFHGPFALLWMGLALLAALTLWRGAMRFGRAEPGTDGFVEASRGAMIDADARLLRASGATQPLLERHMEDRLTAAARTILGRTAGSETFLEALARRAPDQAHTLRELAAQVTAGTPPAAQTWLARFDAALASARKEFET